MQRFFYRKLNKPRLNKDIRDWYISDAQQMYLARRSYHQIHSKLKITIMEELSLKIRNQGEYVRSLKAAPAQQREPSTIAQAIQTLKTLKAEFESLKPNTGNGNGEESSTGMTKFQLKVPKGTKDHHPKEMLIRDKIFTTITKIFKLHGAVTIDTPVFELKEILSGKYGEDSKLIYDLQDQGGELCSLRYDLTDFDIAGATDPMIADAEVLTIACEVLEALEVGEFTIKLNHRKLLDGIFDLCGVPEDKFRAISSAVDKLDKMSWIDVRKEMTEEKGLDPEIADRIGGYVKLKGSEDLLAQLLEDEKLVSNKTAKEGLEEMKLLMSYMNVFGILSRISFDLSLARGLDYYTGVIYEAVVEGSAPPTLPTPSVPTEGSSSTTETTSKSTKSKSKSKTQQTGTEVDESQIGVGSIAAGGRYDNLVGMFSSGKDKIPCVGISFGVERIFSILKSKAAASNNNENLKGKDVDVFVMSVGDGLLNERMKLCKELWDAGLSAEFMYKSKPKTQKQFEIVDRDQIRFAVIIGPEELKLGHVRVKEQVGKLSNLNAHDKAGVVVERDQLISLLKERLST
ncbi:hypothetical protein PSHT_02748 [Puccinia striiformis]|uniref:histidine--tRNA ligase n=1 Tax=Puccinia striiformis TaxID=27350 RepID=A0A2S4WH54_9BASI|nr:hypothetical protein PSHT_02748 [Puccinia striiformis]